MSTSKLDWTIDEVRTQLHTRIFDVVEAAKTCHDGRKGKFVRVSAPDWVVAIPWFVDETGVPCFFMEDQWRHGNDAVVREFPAGQVEKGEAALAAAKRELLEETGMVGDFIELGGVCPNSAFMSNSQTFFLVRNLRTVSGQHLDANEEINVVKVPVEVVVNKMGSGIYANGIMMGALGFFLRYAEQHPELHLRPKKN